MKIIDFLDSQQRENLFYLCDDYELLPIGDIDNETLSETGKIIWLCDREYDGQEIGPQITYFSELVKHRYSEEYDLKCSCVSGGGDHCSTINDCYLSEELVDAIEAAIGDYTDEYDDLYDEDDEDDE